MALELVHSNREITTQGQNRHLRVNYSPKKENKTILKYCSVHLVRFAYEVGNRLLSYRNMLQKGTLNL